MYLFSRTRIANPARPLDAFALAVEIGDYVSKTTGNDIAVWHAMFGAPMGTVTWTARFESQAAMGESLEKLAVDPGYLQLAERLATSFGGHAEDALAEVVAAVGTPVAGAYATVILAECAPGRIAEAMAWGVDTMNHVGKITGTSPMMVRGMYGPFATIGWVTNAASLAEVDAAQKAMSGDPGYIERLDRGGDLFRPGSATTRLIRRLH